MEKPASKWLEFIELERSRSGLTRRYDVRPRALKPGDLEELVTALGQVLWYGAWRRYAFHPEACTVYEPTCLRDIAAFCDWLMAERKAGRK